MLKLNAELLELLEKDSEKFQNCFVKQQFVYQSSHLEHDNEKKLRLMLQQLLMGLPVDLILQAYPTLASYIKQLQLLINILSADKQFNVSRQCLIQDILIVAEYDILLIDEEKATVVNWTTRRNIFENNIAEKSWKTNLQLYLLAETENILPENLSVINLFINSEIFQPIYQFTYNQNKHTLFKKRLEEALINLSVLLKIDKPCTDTIENNHSLDLKNLQKLFNHELSIYEYLSTVPEVEI